MHGLSDDEPEVVGEAVRKPLTPVRCGVAITECNLHPDFAVAYFDREDRYVVRPKIKGAAAFEIEAGVMPMTCQDAVLDGASLEWEAHVRATIVEGEDPPAVVVDDKFSPLLRRGGGTCKLVVCTAMASAPPGQCESSRPIQRRRKVTCG